MRVALDRIDVQSLGVDLEALGRVDIASASALEGAIDQTAERLALEGFGAEEVVLRALRLALGSVTLVNETGATIARLGLALEQKGALLAVGATAGSIVASDLLVDAGTVIIQGKPTLSNAKLEIEPNGGSLFAEGVEAIELVVKVAGLEIHAPALRASGMRIGWGTRGFELTAERVDAPGLRVRGGTIAFDAGTLSVAKVDVGPTGVRTARITLDRGALRVALGKSVDAEPPPARAPSAAPLFDWRVLDGLSGKVDVDALVDVTVPIIGNRRATHALRVPIEKGTIDFRELERNLATLEDAVLDFSVRDGGLALERVNPLLPVRGRGKPIVMWALDEADRALAEHDRVRLSVLPNAKPVTSGSMAPPPPGEAPAKPSGFALRELGLHRIDVKVALAPVTVKQASQLRPQHVDALSIEGQLGHTPDETSPEGRVLADVTNAKLAIAGFPIDDQRLDIGTAALAKTSVDVVFADLTPTGMSVDFTGVTLDAVAVIPANRT